MEGYILAEKGAAHVCKQVSLQKKVEINNGQ